MLHTELVSQEHGLGFGADKLLDEAGYPPVFKKAIGNQFGKALLAMAYNGNNEYIELKNKMLEIKEKTKNIEQLNKIVSAMKKDEKFKEFKNDLIEFREEFIKEIEKEKNMK